ncbi:MAG: hypothetical protein L3J45_07850 [Flavobacteriaceae bacterium]|nr:hypothetical protein [Flavobacteriaceae bacterium]
MKINSVLISRGKFILALFFLFFNLSCQTVLRTIAGVKKPKYETEKSIVNFLNKKEIDLSLNYFISKTEREYVYKNFILPRKILFKNKINMTYISQSNCAPDILSVYKSQKESIKESLTNKILINFNKDTIPRLEKFTFYNDNILGYNGVEKSLPKTKFIIVYHWAKFLPNKFFEEIKELQNLAKNNDDLGLVLVNIDFMNSNLKQ